MLLLKGTARLVFSKGGALDLKAGDYCLIAPRLKHRVEAVSDDALWMALHHAAVDLKSDNPEWAV